MTKSILLLSLSAVLTLYACNQEHPTDPQPQVSNTSANWSDSLKRGLWAFYPIDSASLNDRSGNSRNLRGMSALTFGSDRNGGSNKALYFNGTGSYAICDSGINFPQGDFAISFSINPQNTAQGRIFNKADLNTALGASFVLGFEPQFQNNLVFGVTKDPNICTSFSDLSNTNAIPSFRPLQAGQWYNVVAQFEQGVQSLYVNGRLVSAMYTPNAAFGVCPNAPLYFGIWWPQDPRPFQGRLDNIRVYTRALLEDEIRYLNLNNL